MSHPGCWLPATTSGRDPGPFERVELPSGIVVLGQVRPDDPVVVAQFRIQAGALAEPDGKPGLSGFVARMLVRGQAGRSFEAFNELTDGLGASLGVDGGRLFIDVGIRCLREDLPQLLDLVADVLRRPDFPADEIERVRQEILAGIRDSEQSTAAVADLAMREVLYPAGHPYARRVSGDAESIASISRDDLTAFHSTTFGRRTLVVAVVGGVGSMNDIAGQIEQRFGDWQLGTAASDLPAAAVSPDTTVRVDRVVEGKSQSDLVLGAPAIARDHPDYYALDTANTILGRIGLSGRLGAEVREKRGLAYSVSSGISAGKEAGTFTARGGVSPVDADQALAAIRAEIGRIRDEPVSAEELADAQSYMTGVLPIALERSGGVAATLLTIEYHDLGLDYIERYPEIIRALTVDDIQAAVRAHLDPDRVVIATAGPPIPATKDTQ